MKTHPIAVWILSVGALFPAGRGVLLLGLMSSALCGAPIAVEDFESYSTGSLAGQGSAGNGWGGAWQEPATSGQQTVVSVAADPLSYASGDGVTVHGGNQALQLTGSSSVNTVLYRQLGQEFTGDDMWVSFLFRYEAGTLQNNDFCTLWGEDTLANATGSDHTDRPNMGLKANHGNGSGTEDFYIREELNEEAFFYDLDDDSPSRQTHFLIGHIEKETGGSEQNWTRFEMWVDPDANDDETTADVFASGNGSIPSMEYIGLRIFKQSTATDDDEYLLDAFTFGETFADVVVIPEPGSLFFMIVAGLTLATRRRRCRPNIAYTLISHGSDVDVGTEGRDNDPQLCIQMDE